MSLVDMYGELYLMLSQIQAKFITQAFFSDMFSHIINKYHTEARKVSAIRNRSIINVTAFQIYGTDTGTFLISSAPG
jgi:hypothetical protein